MGFFGNSHSAAITKNIGALIMSITSTARKATVNLSKFCHVWQWMHYEAHWWNCIVHFSTAVKSLKWGKSSKKQASMSGASELKVVDRTTTSKTNNGYYHHIVWFIREYQRVIVEKGLLSCIWHCFSYLSHSQCWVYWCPRRLSTLVVITEDEGGTAPHIAQITIPWATIPCPKPFYMEHNLQQV